MWKERVFLFERVYKKENPIYIDEHNRFRSSILRCTHKRAGIKRWMEGEGLLQVIGRRKEQRIKKGSSGIFITLFAYSKKNTL